MGFCRVKNFSVQYSNSDRLAVNAVNLEVRPGRTTALIGESGSGKTTLGLGIMGLLSDISTVHLRGCLTFLDRNYAPDSPDLATLRGKHIGYIFQEPLLALNPLYTIGRQLLEVLRWHNMPQPMQTCKQWLERVGLDQRVYKQYPHQLSGGMRQRVMIALALAPGPDLVIADEPTSGIDAVLKNDILHLLCDLAENKALLLITHDLAVAARFTDDMYVMQSGNIIESGHTDNLINSPQHEYTRLLIQRYQASMQMMIN